MTARHPRGPVETARGAVYPWQSDQLGHINVQFFTAKFDEASWHFLAMLGLTPTRVREQRHSLAAVEQRTRYKRELLSGSLIRITTEMLEVRPKTIRFLHRMYDAETADEVATMEITAVYMDLDARKSTPIPAELSTRFAAAIASE